MDVRSSWTFTLQSGAEKMNNSTVNFTSPEVYPSTINLMIGVLCLNVVFGFPTHSYVLWLIVKRTGIALEFFNFNLTVCGIIYSLKSLLYILEFKFPSITILQILLEGLTMTSSPLFQCLICVERFLAVVHPVTFLKFKPLRYKVICCILVWMAGLLSSVCCMHPAILSSVFALIWFYSIQFLLFFSVQLFCLSAVLRALKRSGPGERGREREDENHMKRKAFNLILITTVTILIMFLPYIIKGFLTVVGQNYDLMGWFVSLACFSLGTFVHPVLYLHRVGKLFCFHFS